jgi:hypothetical protein
MRADFEVTFGTEHETGKANPTSVVAEARGMYAGEPVVARFAGD